MRESTANRMDQVLSVLEDFALIDLADEKQRYVLATALVRELYDVRITEEELLDSFLPQDSYHES